MREKDFITEGQFSHMETVFYSEQIDTPYAKRQGPYGENDKARIILCKACCKIIFHMLKSFRRDFMSIVKIHVCPNDCAGSFLTSAHVVQTWKVDAEGNFVEKVSTDETTHGPDNDNIWTCSICGEEALIVECRIIEVEAENKFDSGRLYLPIKGNGKAYFMPYGMADLYTLPIFSVDGKSAVTYEGTTFTLDGTILSD